MIRTRLGLLGLCAMIFGVMAFGASAAQAETGAAWLILTSKGELKKAGDIIGGTALRPSVAGELESASLDLLVPNVLGFHFLIECTAGTALGAKLEANGTLSSGSKLTFSGCRTRLNFVLNEACQPHTIGSFKGEITTNQLKGLLVLAGGVGRTRIEPSVGETLVSINMGEECPIGETIPLSGKLYLLDESLATHLVKHLVREDLVNTDLWVLNKTGGHKATINGNALVFLTGAHEGLQWSGDPA